MRLLEVDVPGRLRRAARHPVKWAEPGDARQPACRPSQRPQGLVPMIHDRVGSEGMSGSLSPLPQICHSKSGEINPVKVGNLVKAYVDKYRHMRRHRRAEAGEEPPAQGAEG